MKFLKSINLALDTLLADNKDVVFYGEDLADPYGGAFKVSRGLSTKYPEQVFSTPISEAAITGMAGGMAIGGLRPIVEIMFGDFLALTMDQILNHLTKYSWMYDHQVNTPVLIRAAMGGRRGYGPTHSQSLEALLASVPRLKILSPSIYHNPGDLLRHAVLSDDEVKVFSEYKMLYSMNIRTETELPEGLSFRRMGELYPTVYLSNCEFENPELVIVTHGGNSALVEEIMIHLLIEYELGVECVIPSVIKPVPIDDIRNGLRSSVMVLFLEESSIDFGWSAEVISQLTESGDLENRQVVRIGAKNTPIPSGISLEADVLPGKDSILSQVRRILNP